MGDATWERFSAHVAEIFHEAMGGLYIFDKRDGATAPLSFFGVDDRSLEEFLAHYAYVNPYAVAAVAGAPEGAPLTDATVLPRDDARKTEFYNDWIRPQGKDVLQVGLKVAQSEDRAAILAIHPDPGSYDANLPRYLNLISMIAPHFANAVRISKRLARDDQKSRTLESVLQGFDAAALLLDEAARPITMNTVAEQLFTPGGPLRLDPSGAVRARGRQDEAALRAAVARAALLPLSAPRPVRLADAARLGRYVAWLAPARSMSTRPTQARLSDLFEPKAALLMIVTRLSGELAVAPAVLAASLGITSAEARLAAALARGKTLAKYAAENDLSRNTVRNQLTKIFEKVGVNTQKDLVAMTATVAGGMALSMSGGGGRGGADD